MNKFYTFIFKNFATRNVKITNIKNSPILKKIFKKANETNIKKIAAQKAVNQSTPKMPKIKKIKYNVTLIKPDFSLHI